MRATFDHKEKLSAHIHTFWFMPEKKARFTAGQFTELTLQHEADERGTRRWFTVSSAPEQPLLGITTRIDPKRPSSFKQQLFALQPGTEVALAEPMGDFVLPKTEDMPIVFVAGGIGITPMHSMIQWLTDTSQRRNITLYHAAKLQEDLVFHDLFESASITYRPILESPPLEWTGGDTGRLSTEYIAALPHVMTDALVYLSGPEPMVESFYKGLKQKGVPEHRLVTDYFPGYTEDNL